MFVAHVVGDYKFPIELQPCFTAITSQRVSANACWWDLHHAKNPQHHQVNYEVKIPPSPMTLPQNLCVFWNVQLFAANRNQPQSASTWPKRYQLNQLGAIQAQHPTSNGSAVSVVCFFPTPRKLQKIDPQRWHCRSSNILVPSHVPYWPSSNWPWPISPCRHESWPLGHRVLVGGKDGDVEGGD